jgi:hypothetical protein
MIEEFAWPLFQAGTDWPGVRGSPVLMGVIVVTALGTGTLFAISLLAFVRRSTTRYLLVALAIGALFFRTVVGFGTVLGIVPMPLHHFTEHSLDFLIAALVLYTVLRNRSSRLDGEFDGV